MFSLVDSFRAKVKNTILKVNASAYITDGYN